MCFSKRFFSSSLVAAIVIIAGLQPSHASTPTPGSIFSTIDPVNTHTGADPNPPLDPNTKWIDVSSGGEHSCGILGTGGLFCWGNNDFGQAAAPKGSFKSVAAGGIQSCAITNEGGLKCWGSSSAIPKKTPAGKFLHVSAGDVHTCAIGTNHRVRCWGSNDYQQARAPSGKFESISAGGRHTCGVKIDGGLDCWGESSFLASQIPLGRFKAVATGEDHACAIRNDDTLVCWGNNAYGQADAPAGTFKSVTASDFNTCGLGYDGTVQCWGRDLLLNNSGSTYQGISTGGSHICGITLSDTMSCWGSNESHNLGGGGGIVQAIPSAFLIQASGFRGIVQAIPFAFLIQASGFIGTGLVNYGKGVDQKWDKAESRNIKFQLAMLGTSLALSAFQNFMPKPPDPVAESLARIEANLAELRVSIDRIDAGVEKVNKQLINIGCNASLDPIIAAANKLKTAEKNYKYLISSSAIKLKAYREGRSPSVDRKEFDTFSNNADELSTMINQINSALIPDLSSKESAIKVCMEKSFGTWKDGAKNPFDDKIYYEPIYEILAYAWTHQALALMMLQDIYLYQSQKKLDEGKVNYSPGDMVGYCANVRSNAAVSGEKQAVWQAAQQWCDRASELTKEVYQNMVRHIERAGAPYTGDDTILSFGSNLIGKGHKDFNNNWLWVRDVDAYGYTKGLHSNQSIQPPENLIKDYGQKKGEYLFYKWQPAGQAWLDIEEVFYNQLGSEEKKDLPITMRDEVNFKNITDRVIWITNQTFKVKLSDMANEPKKFTGQSVIAKAFVASGIKTGNGGRHVLGIITNQWKFRWFTGKTTWNDSVQAIGSRQHDSNGFEKYTDVLGSFTLSYLPNKEDKKQAGDYTFCSSSPLLIGIPWGWEPVCGNSPRDGDMALTRWPVLNVSTLECSNAMFSNNKRKATNDVGAPKRCGSDLDRVINDLIPRPLNVDGRVPLPENIKQVSIIEGGSSSVKCIVNTTDASLWFRPVGFKWTVVDPITLKSASDETRKWPTEDRSPEYQLDNDIHPVLLAKKIGNPKVVHVGCSSTVMHGETGTRYDVSSPTYQFDTTTNQLIQAKN